MASEFQREVFGRTLRRALDDFGMSQRALARAAGVSPNAVSQWVLGKAVPRPDMVACLERLLQLEEGTLGRLLGYIPAAVQDQALRSVVEAIRADPRLGERERKLLETMYQELIRHRAAEQDSRGSLQQGLPESSRRRRARGDRARGASS